MVTINSSVKCLTNIIGKLKVLLMTISFKLFRLLMEKYQKFLLKDFLQNFFLINIGNKNLNYLMKSY